MPTRKEKIAVARILDDLIKADRIVDTGEMECWANVCVKYGIDREVRICARDISFADALRTICGSDTPGLREDLLGDCRSITVSDGFCAHSEALMMASLTMMLDTQSEFEVEAISIPRASFNVDMATVLYIENEFDALTNEAIESNYRLIYKELQLAGFHFLYIPRIIDHYRHTVPALFKEILSFLAPSMSDSGLDTTYRSLLKMNTGIFCKDLLCNKCGITELRNTYPSLLIKIGNSFVGSVQYANYLKIEVDEGIVATVQGFIDRFLALLSTDIYVVSSSEERDNQFHFHGFYKQLLDIVLVRHNIRSEIVIDPYRQEILFPDIDSKAQGLHRRERALYALLLCQGDDGLNFNRPRTPEEAARYDRRMQRIGKRYAAIYELFGGDRDTAPDLSIPEIRRPIIACLRRSLRNLQGLYNPDDYTVTRDTNDNYAVHIEPELVFVRTLDSPDPVPLHESEMYRKWKSL